MGQFLNAIYFRQGQSMYSTTIRLENNLIDGGQPRAKHDHLASFLQMEFSPRLTASSIKLLVRNPRVRITLYLK